TLEIPEFAASGGPRGPRHPASRTARRQLEKGSPMATMITSECINCGACEPECPNTAIYQGGVEWTAPDGSMHPPLSNDIFYIVPEKCTECVGFHDHEACAAVCPVDCCVPDPNIPETHEVLLERARVLHPELTIADDAPSRFKKEGAAAPAAQGNGHAAAAPVPATPAAAAPKPVAAVAAPPAPKAAAPAPPARGRVEKPVAPPPKAVRPAPTFAGELALDYDQLAAELGAPPRRRRSGVAPAGELLPRGAACRGLAAWRALRSAPLAGRQARRRGVRPPGRGEHGVVRRLLCRP